MPDTQCNCPLCQRSRERRQVASDPIFVALGEPESVTLDTFFTDAPEEDNPNPDYTFRLVLDRLQRQYGYEVNEGEFIATVPSQSAAPRLYVNRYGYSDTANPTDWERSADRLDVLAWMRDKLTAHDEGCIFQLTINESSYRLPGTVEFYKLEDGALIRLEERPVHRRCSHCRVTSWADRRYFREYESGNFDSVCRQCRRRVRQQRELFARHGRRFGVEIEVIPMGEYVDSDDIARALTEAGIQCVDEGYTHEVMDTWKVVSDGSIDGWEVVSPPLTWADRGQVAEVCAVLEDLGCEADESCGLHVHHDVSDLDTAQFQRLFALWADAQHHTDRLVSYDRHGTQWCRYIEQSELDAVMDLDSLEQIGNLCFDRYKALNVSCYNRYGTVEVRQHQGTTDPAEIIAWVAYTRGMIDRAKDGATEMLSALEAPEYLDNLPIEEDHLTYLKTRKLAASV